MTCKDCLHCEVCEKKHYHYANNKYRCNIDFIEKVCVFFKDKSKSIELPCKVGDTVYCLDTLVDKDKCDKCPFYYEGGMGDYPACEKSITGSRSAECIEIKEEIGTLKDILWWMFRNDFGKTVFLTKSEAEQKLKELLGDN